MSMKTSRRKRTSLVVALSVSALIGGACSSDASDSSSETSAAPATTDASMSTDTTGGDAGNRDGQTIRVGYVNNDALAADFRIGGEVAIDFINSQGGINGAQIEVVSCDADGSPEGSINCANKLIEENVVLAYTGLDVSSDAAIPIYAEAGIPYITSNGWGVVQESDPNSFILHAASGAYFVAPLKTMKDLGLTDVGWVFASSPATEGYKAKVEGYAETLGINLKQVLVDATTPDWTGAVASLQAEGVDGIAGILTEVDCIGLATALSSLAFDGARYMGSCSVYATINPDAAVGTYTQGDNYVYNAYDDAPAEFQVHLDEYAEAMKAAGQEKLIVGFAQPPFGAWMELREVLTSIANDQEITSEAIKAAIVSQVFPGYFGPDLQCGQKLWADSPSACHSSIAVYQVTKNDDGTLGRKLVLPLTDMAALVN